MTYRCINTPWSPDATPDRSDSASDVSSSPSEHLGCLRARSHHVSRLRLLMETKDRSNMAASYLEAVGMCPFGAWPDSIDRVLLSSSPHCAFVGRHLDRSPRCNPGNWFYVPELGNGGNSVRGGRSGGSRGSYREGAG
jgi:hypothetical protein